MARAPGTSPGHALGRVEDINLYIDSFIMTDQTKIIMKEKRKTYNTEGHAHELTFSCYHQYDYFNDTKCCTIFMEELQLARDKYKFHLWAYVLMPTHVQENPELFEKMCIEIRKKNIFRFWQAGGGFDRNLWNAKAIHSSINYIEANPVRAELVEYPED